MIQTLTLRPDIYEAKQRFMHNYNPEVPINTLSYDQASRVGHSFVIQQYLKEVHNIETSEQFRKALLKAHFKSYPSNNFHMPFKIVDSIICACELWKPYLSSEDEFLQLVHEELLSYAAINCSVIKVSSFEKKERNLRTLPPYRFQTVVTQRGTIRVFP